MLHFSTAFLLPSPQRLSGPKKTPVNSGCLNLRDGSTNTKKQILKRKMCSETQLCDMHNIHLNSSGESTASLEQMIHFNFVSPWETNKFVSLKGFALENWPLSECWEVPDTHISIQTHWQALKRDIPTAGKKQQVGKTLPHVDPGREGRKRDAFPAEAASWRTSFTRHEWLIFSS